VKHNAHRRQSREAAWPIVVLACLVGGSAGLAAPTNAPVRHKHWSFTPVVRPAVPATQHGTRSLNPIDAFIIAKLRENHLTQSPEADRRTLIRRLYFDLIGLPPTPEGVKAFEENTEPGAYASLVEKLLASPRYGERWARHWLDVVRFAETHGFEMNQPRPNAWLYRDYVIRAFNEDKPFDRFILEQLAGDALGVDEATGFLVAGPWDQVKSPDVVLTSMQRADELHDIVSAAGSAFLGLTVGCARCHDHKFDPVPQTDYYAVKACFAGVQHGERKLRTPDAEVKEQEATRRRGRLAEVERALEEFEPLACVGQVDTNHLRAAVNARKNVERFAPVPARRLRFTVGKTTDAEPCLDELEVYTSDDTPRNVALASAGTQARASSVFPNSDIHRLEHIHDGRHGNGRSWISNERGQGWVELEFPEQVTISKVIWGRDREQKFSDRLALDYRIEVAVGSNDWQLVASARDRQPYVPGSKAPPACDVARFGPAEQARVKALLAERAEHEAKLKELANSPMVYAGTFTAQPEPTRRLHRGDPMQPREAVPPGALSVISVKIELQNHPPASATAQIGEVPVRALTDDQQRRLALAKWMADPANPLTARVMVNRLWQYHFGEGLVNTPSDFGANGARPTHPELLDWLASEFNARGWSVKAMHRLMVNSATYRQASAMRPECLAIDAGSRLFWRYPPRRLEAEAIRDAILSVSGKLDLRMGGPGFSFFEPNDNYVRVYAPRQEWPPDTWRRMIYGTIVRQRPDGVFGAFDCPDGGQIAPHRTRSTTPLQALNLLNSSFILQQSHFLAERLERDVGPDAEAQVHRAFELAFQRQPSTEEIVAAKALLREHSLNVFCRALLNGNEFVYVF
jgi:hypothetical protein